MAVHGSEHITITILKTTVAKLRDEKGGVAWDTFMLNSLEGMKQGVKAKCAICRKVVGSTDVDLSPSLLAKRLGWKEISVKGRLDSIGFLCDKCSSEMEKREGDR